MRHEAVNGWPEWERFVRPGGSTEFWTTVDRVSGKSLFVRLIEGKYVVVDGRGYASRPIKLSAPFDTLDAAITAAMMIGRVD